MPGACDLLHPNSCELFVDGPDGPEVPQVNEADYWEASGIGW
jgi:hypothetical protein